MSQEVETEANLAYEIDGESIRYGEGGYGVLSRKHVEEMAEACHAAMLKAYPNGIPAGHVSRTYVSRETEG